MASSQASNLDKPCSYYRILGSCSLTFPLYDKLLDLLGDFTGATEMNKKSALVIELSPAFAASVRIRLVVVPCWPMLDGAREVLPYMYTIYGKHYHVLRSSDC